MNAQDFQEFINNSIDKNPQEATMLRKIIRSLKAAGTPIVSVWDGGESHPVRTERDIFEWVFNLDECHLYTESGSWVFFVMGNEWDCLVDHTVDLEDALKPVQDFWERVA